MSNRLKQITISDVLMNNDCFRVFMVCMCAIEAENPIKVNASEINIVRYIRQFVTSCIANN